MKKRASRATNRYLFSKAVLCLGLLPALVALAPKAAWGSFEALNMEASWQENDFAIVSMVAFHGSIYVGTKRERDLEADPPVSGGCEVLRLYPQGDLWTWSLVNTTGFDEGNGLGWHNFSVAAMHVFEDHLYVGTWNHFSGGQLWRTRAGVSHPTSLADWERVDPQSFSGHAVTSLAVKDNLLYAGIYTQQMPLIDPPCAVWRSPDGQNWSKVNLGGFGDPFNSDATAMAVHQGHLYVGTENGFFFNLLRLGTGTEIWRNPGGSLPEILTDWVQVNTNGFGQGEPNPSNRNTTMMISHGNDLFVGTENRNTGAELWRFDGSRWEREHFTETPTRNNLSISYHSGAVFEADLYVCTRNHFTGGEVWRLHGEQWGQVNASGFDEAHWVAVAPIVFEDRLIVAGNGPQGAKLYAINAPAPDDLDADGVPDALDICPKHWDPLQGDTDQNGIGDACQDEDGDKVPAKYDCDDQDSLVHPGAGDPCRDGLDWDCNGLDQGWEWADDGLDSNCNNLDNCGTVPVDHPAHGFAALLLPWFVGSHFYRRLKRKVRRSGT